MPIDSAPMPSFWCQAISEMDFPVTYSKFGEQVIRKQVPDVRDKLRMIYHGIDTKTFYPEDREYIRQRNGLDPDNFILLYVGVNSVRKQIPRLIEAFDVFARDKEDVILFLHTALEYNAGSEGWFLKEILRQYPRLKNKILISKKASPIAGVSENRLRVMYNMADAFVSATECERIWFAFCRGRFLQNSFYSC